MLFNLPVIGEAVKKLLDDLRVQLSSMHQSAPARLRDLIAHHYFALDTEIVWEVTQRHMPALLADALALRSGLEQAGSD